MTAAVLTGHGGPDALEVRHDVPTPTADAGEVVLAVTAAGVNTTDVWTRRGAYGTPEDPDAVAGWQGRPIDVPRVQGGDAVGRVIAVGPDVEEGWLDRRVLVDPIDYGPELAPGEHELAGVLGSEEDGAFADLLAVPVSRIHDVDAAPLSDEQLACLPIAYGTATGMLERTDVGPGETVLVTGASGGVGLALVQLAAARGATVIALTSAATADRVVEAGAAHAVLRDDDHDPAGTCRSLAPDGVDVVADVVGGPSFGWLLDALRTTGRFVTCGAVAGPVVELDLRVLYLRRRRLIGSTMHTPTQFRRLVADANAGRCAPLVARTYDLEDIHRAQRDLEEGSHVGNLVLRPPMSRA